MGWFLIAFCQLGIRAVRWDSHPKSPFLGLYCPIHRRTNVYSPRIWLNTTIQSTATFTDSASFFNKGGDAIHRERFEFDFEQSRHCGLRKDQWRLIYTNWREKRNERAEIWCAKPWFTSRTCLAMRWIVAEIVGAHRAGRFYCNR